MDTTRALLAATKRPQTPQRAVSGGGSYGSSHLPKRPTFPSRLSNVRSASQPVNIVDLTADGTQAGQSNESAFLGNREAVVRSPDVIDLEEDDGQPPAKRVKTSEDGFGPARDDIAADRQDMADVVVPGSPLPSLPWTNCTVKDIAGQRRHRFGIDPAARRADGVKPPAAATRVPEPKKIVDFTPWTGTHPEDTINETAIKAGFFDKGQGANHSEVNSAKATIWPNLSQRGHHGLTMLGCLFTAVMDRRLANGRCTAPSTFKPPPRVTVTDTKREAWLRDLANPEVPLRKQSRTIPHGIRGKLLMEQCLSKSIPLQRAVWLAKCVGANELRGLRRKGVSGPAAASGEVKWIRDWTISVEQFLEGVIMTCGQKDWQRSMHYALKLATAFYAEKLLDAEHYLDWIVSSLSEARLDRLPIWIIVAQIYWKDITTYGRRARKLAEAVLKHLHHITSSKLETDATLKTRLQKLVAVLAVTNRGCLVIPRTWQKYKYLLAANTGNLGTDTPASSIAKRNERLAAPLYKTAASIRSPLLDLYDHLDSIGLEVDMVQLAERCQSLVPDPARLIPALLDWASTPYRTDTARVYLVAGIIAHLHRAGHDTGFIILEHLSSTKAVVTEVVSKLHMVVVKIARLGAFSVGRYLQWLITSGAMSSREATCATSLIAALPVAGLPGNVLSTRTTLMSRLGYPTDETAAVEDVLTKVNDVCARAAAEHVDPIRLPEILTMSAKLNISGQLVSKISGMAKVVGISLEAFTVVRDVVERMSDMSSLAALVETASSSTNTLLLATTSDTINLHAETFAALGQLQPLTTTLTEQYRHLRSTQPLDRTFILALTDLARRFPLNNVSFIKLLNSDLAVCEQQNPSAVCSPASDSLIGMHTTRLESDNDIDAVFASGNTMDDGLVQRVFGSVMVRAPKPPGTSPQGAVSKVCAWLNQLRAVDSSGVLERLAKNYVRAFLKSDSDGAVSRHGVFALVASGCMALGTVAEMARDVKTPQTAGKMLDIFLSRDILSIGMSDIESYRFRVQQERCQTDHTDALLCLAITACGAPEFFVESSNLIQFAIRCSTTKSELMIKLFEEGARSKTALENVGRMMTAILLQPQGGHDKGTLGDLQSIVEMADPLSLPYCVGAIRYFRHVGIGTPEDDVTLGEALIRLFVRRSETWPQLLEFAGDNVSRMLHGWAQDELLNEASKGPYEGDYMERCLDLLAVTNQAASKSDSTVVVAAIAESLKEFERRLSVPGSVETELSSLHGQLRTLLNLCVMHVHALQNESESSKHARCSLLSTLCSLLVCSKLQVHRDLTEYIYDLASTLFDSIADYAAQALPRVRPLPPDPRLESILGHDASNPPTWLALVSKVQPLQELQTQQQRALNKHISPQGQHSQPQISLTSQRPQLSVHVQQGTTPQRWPSYGGPPGLVRQDSSTSLSRAAVAPHEVKTTPYPLRRWEIMQDPTPSVGENDTSLSLSLFGARRV